MRLERTGRERLSNVEGEGEEVEEVFRIEYAMMVSQEG